MEEINYSLWDYIFASAKYGYFFATILIIIGVLYIIISNRKMNVFIGYIIPIFIMICFSIILSYKKVWSSIHISVEWGYYFASFLLATYNLISKITKSKLNNVIASSITIFVIICIAVMIFKSL